MPITRKINFVLAPGEQVEFVIRASRTLSPTPLLPEDGAPIQDLAGRYILPVPYLSQWSPTAKRAPGDCGPATVTMAIHYLTPAEPTIDEVSEASQVQPGAHYAGLEQVARGARIYHLKPTLCRPLTRDKIKEQIGAGRPIIALVNYGMLPDNQDAGFKGAHFVLIVGFGPDTCIFHDPDRLSGDEFGEFREISWPVFLNALGTVSRTPGNSYDNTGILLDV
jgi:hypothetical protein